MNITLANIFFVAAMIIGAVIIFYTIIKENDSRTKSRN